MKLDLSNKNLRKIEPLNDYADRESNNVEIAVFDNNIINKLEHLESYRQEYPVIAYYFQKFKFYF
jgi:hypothetical protein